ncbi:MAG: exonuclease domain-containing protein [Gaiella sp.]
MQLTFDAADRLVELLQAERGPVPAAAAARALFALKSAPSALARSLLDDVVTEDARLAWSGDLVTLAAPPGSDLDLSLASFVVVDLETTGLRPGSARICEIGAQRVERLELTETFATLVDPGVPLPPVVTALTGIQRSQLRGAPRAELAVRRLLEFSGDAVFVAHNARFDLGFLDIEVERFTGRRIAGPVVDTVWLARRLLQGRLRRVGLASLAHFFGASTEPCHRALPDAVATAEIFLHLIGLAQERGVRTVAELVDLAAPRARRLHDKRALIAGAPATPGTYVFRDASGQPLYVGRARSLRSRLRSYFSGERQRPAVEAALMALAAVEWRVAGSELEAALWEVRMLRDLRPVANVRAVRPDHGVYLSRTGSVWKVVQEPTACGPLRSRSLARRAARALDGHDSDDLSAALPTLEARMRRHAREQRFEEAGRLRDRMQALEKVAATVGRLERLRAAERCLLAPAREPGFVFAAVVRGGRVAAEGTLPTGGGLLAEATRLVTTARWAGLSFAPEDTLELTVVEEFLRRPPPELRIAGVDPESIVRAARGLVHAFVRSSWLAVPRPSSPRTQGAPILQYRGD